MLILIVEFDAGKMRAILKAEVMRNHTKTFMVLKKR